MTKQSLERLIGDLDASFGQPATSLVDDNRTTLGNVNKIAYEAVLVKTADFDKQSVVNIASCKVISSLVFATGLAEALENSREATESVSNVPTSHEILNVTGPNYIIIAGKPTVSTVELETHSRVYAGVELEEAILDIFISEIDECGVDRLFSRLTADEDHISEAAFADGRSSFIAGRYSKCFDSKLSSNPNAKINS